ncbi:MAG: hypothetical protein ACFFAJ_15995, partial [Candidatus Hodarchaeota archaeon]
PALLLLPPNLLEGGQLGELLKQGSMIKEQNKDYLPRNAIMKPFGSAKILCMNWEMFMNISSFKSFIS